MKAFLELRNLLTKIRSIRKTLIAQKKGYPQQQTRFSRVLMPTLGKILDFIGKSGVKFQLSKNSLYEWSTQSKGELKNRKNGTKSCTMFN
jgi:hypothetical protein